MAADTLMVQVALIAALVSRLFWQIAFFDREYADGYGETARFYLAFYANNAWPLTIVVLVTLYLMGVYTYSRFYQSRYRALVVFQAVTLAFLIFAALRLFVITAPLPRITLALAWLYTSGLVVSARVWSQLFERIIRPERQAMLSARRGAGQNILVIGGAGYIGSALLGKLLAKGHHVRLLDLMVFGDEPISHLLHHKNLEVMHGDFRHVESVVEAMQGMDAVIHLGAIVGDPACSLDENLTIDVNLTATRMIGELAKAHGVRRFIFASTCSVYGACDEILDERSFVRPISLYGQTKLASEQILFKMATDQFKPTIVRFATIYGLSGRTRFDLVVNLLTAKAKLEGKITVNGGAQWRPFVHVDDAAAAVARIVEAPLQIVAGEIFNVGSNEQNYTISQIGELVHEQVVSAELIVNETDTDRRNYRVNFNKIRNHLGFDPQWTVERGIQQVLEAIANGDVQDYRDARYSNVKFLTESANAAIVRDNWARRLIESLPHE
ncbi:MAG: NAD-dependent dehydratase [Planctomycetota bacterium]|nr:MAG: NAD-dependent dehydratase [Planctomycetota bacterium]